MVAVVIGVAFLAATLMLSSSITSSVANLQTAAIGDADAVVSASSETAVVPAATIKQVQQMPGVTSVEASRFVSLMRTDGGTAAHVNGHFLPKHPKVVSGHAPQGLQQVAVNQRAIDSGTRVGSSITLAPLGGGNPRTFTVAGVIDPDPRTSMIRGNAEVYLDPTALGGLVGSSGADTLYVTSSDPNLVPQLSKVVGSHGVVRSAADERAHQLEETSTGTVPMTAFMAGFAVIALVVAAMVIVNTFTILVAQRTRTLALARCIGATRRQVRRSVLLEALLVGALGSVVGVALGVGVAQLLVTIIRSTTPMPLDSTVSVSVVSCVVPLLLGVVVTVLAAWRPALRATTVSPMAALMPVAEAPTRRVGRVRTVIGVLMVGLGAALVVVAAMAGLEAGAATLTGVAGGLVSFAGILVVSPVLVGSLTRLAGRLVARVGGVPAELAVDNAQRNPRRTATTASALLIGVTLIVTTATGAATARATVSAQLDGKFPVDAVVTGTQGLDDATIRDAGHTSGVSGVATVTTATGSIVHDGSTSRVSVQGIGDSMPRVSRDPSRMAGLDSTHAIAALPGVADGQRIQVQVGGRTADLTVIRRGDESSTVMVSQSVMERLAPGARPGSLQVRFADGSDSSKVTGALTRAMSSHTGVTVQSVSEQRAQYDKILNVMLAMVVGLLVISVIIAMVGVANTLGLSVVERTREIGLLRALGLTRRQVRAMFGHEAALVSVVAVLLGAALGIGYGVAGVHAVLGKDLHVIASVPWLQVLGVAAVAIAAGWLASVLPGRRGARIRPAVALSEE